MATPSLGALAFDDEFDSFQSSPRGGSVGWATELPFWNAEHTLSGNNEAEYYVDSSQPNSPFSVTNGVLNIQASAASTTGANPLGLAYNSGAITTYKSFSQLYGYFEIRAQLPGGAGLWPAFWLMPTNFKPGPEIDAFEVLGDRPNVLYASVHGATPGSSVEQPVLVADTSAAFHTYGVDWGPQKTVFYMDGQVIATIATPADMDVPMYMILNLAVGGTGSWPGAPTAQTQFPANLKIDYVHAYQTANTIGWTDPAPVPPRPLVLPAVQAAAVYGNAQAYVNVQHYGNEDGGTGIGGIGVVLRNAAGLIVATGVTDARGFYTFLNLAPGTYSVQYIPPEQYSVRPGNFADPNTGRTPSFTLSSGQNYPVPYQFVTSSAELAGTVQLDGKPVSNITVSLLDANGTTLSTAATDANGHFDFWAAAGQYEIAYAAPAGTQLATGSLADPNTGLTIPIALADGQTFMLIPEQLVSTTPIVPASAVPLPPVTIALFNDSGVSATDMITSSASLIGSGGAGATVTIRQASTVLGTTTADGVGNWSYAPTGLADGNYALSATETDAAGNAHTATIAITLDTVAPKPAMKIVTGIAGGGVTLAGVSEANSTVTIADTSNGVTTVVGSVTAGTNGAWSLTNHAAIDVSKIHAYTVRATDVAGNTGAMPGTFYLASTGNDVLTGTANASDVFAIMSFKGSETIKSFEASSVVGANHDYIDFSGRGITSFGQVQSMMSGTTSTAINIGSGKTITIANIAPSLFSAADFRYS